MCPKLYISYLWIWSHLKLELSMSLLFNELATESCPLWQLLLSRTFLCSTFLFSIFNVTMILSNWLMKWGKNILKWFYKFEMFHFRSYFNFIFYHAVNTTPESVFTTLYFLHNILMGTCLIKECLSKKSSCIFVPC